MLKIDLCRYIVNSLNSMYIQNEVFYWHAMNTKANHFNLHNTTTMYYNLKVLFDKQKQCLTFIYYVQTNSSIVIEGLYL